MSVENREKQYKLQLERSLKGGPSIDPMLVEEFAPPQVIVPKKKAKKVNK